MLANILSGGNGGDWQQQAVALAAPALHGFFVLWGLADVLFGYRLFRLTLGLAGALAGGLVGSSVGAQLAGAGWTGPLIGLLVGAVVGAVAAYGIYKVGLFLAGAAAGALAVLPLVAAQEPWVVNVAMGVAGLCTGLALVCLARVAIIVATSFTGAFRLVFGAAFFIGGPDLLRWALERSTDPAATLTPAVLGLAMLVATAVGIVFQLLTTQPEGGKTAK